MAATTRRLHVAQYVDYLDVDGALIASANGAPLTVEYHQRVWRVSTVRLQAAE